MRRRELMSVLSVAGLGWPFAARAQETAKVYRIALFNPAAPIAEMSAEGNSRYRAFFGELQRLGYAERRNLVIDRRSGEGDTRRLSALARQIAAVKPDVIFAISNRAVDALKAATTTIPIVALAVDPVAFGLAASLARPGGNITGFAIDTGRAFVEKQFELLKQVVPTASKVAILIPRGAWESRIGAFYREAANAAGIATVGAVLESPADEMEYRRAITAAARDRADVLYVMAAPDNLYRRRIIVAIAAEVRLPAVYVTREHVEAGGLIAYAVDFVDVYRRAAGYVGQILKGANPAAMPFQQPTKFELLINLKTAKALGLTLAPELLARADEVIE